MRRLLLVQGHAPTAELLEMLASAGHRVLVANDAESALAIAGRRPLLNVIAHYRLAARSGVWFFEQLRHLQPRAQRILVADDPRLDTDRLIERGTIHAALPSMESPSMVLDRVAGIPETMPYGLTPVVSVPCF